MKPTFTMPARSRLMVRGSVLSQATRPYIESARVLGLRRRRIMFRHILPNVLPVAFATMLLNIAFALVAMSALSFLGLGVEPGEPDWGRQLSDGRDLLGRNSAAVIVPGVLIIEALAQTGAVLMSKTLEVDTEGKTIFFMSIDGVRFRRPVVPGDRLELHVQKVQSRANVWKFSGRAMVEGKVAAEATFAAMIRDR